MPAQTLAIDFLKSILSYDPMTGGFTNLVARGAKSAGTPAGTYHPNGYVVVCIGYRPFRAHRLAWFYMTGEWPSRVIDHADGDKHNNKWSNLRLATRTENNANQPRPVSNTSGYKGVTWNAKNGRWQAQIHISRHAYPVDTYSLQC